MSVRFTFLLCALFVVPAAADWPYYGGDAASTKFAPYDGIHAGNADSLRIVWRWRLPNAEVSEDEGSDDGIGGDGVFKSTPLVVDGVLYTSTPFAQVVALDAASGRRLWTYRLGHRVEEATLCIYRDKVYCLAADGYVHAVE